MRLVATLLATFLALPASAADWREAETIHFRIVSAGSEKDLLRFAERLEHFHALLKLATGATEANRRTVKVRVYLVNSLGEVKALFGRPDSEVAGFYNTRDDGAIAVVPRTTGDGIFTGQLVLFHEYAHHYMLQYTPAAYPSWYVEGFAEIASTASFERKDAITFGKAASHRQYELELGERYPAAKMLDGTYVEDRAKGRGWGYGDAWLLTHYLTFAEQRRGQLRTYLNAINAGRKPAEAARAFGDLAALQREVNGYLSARNFSYRAVPLPEGAAGGIRLRTLGAAEAALIDRTIELERLTSLPVDDDDDEAEQAKDAKPAKDDFDTRLAAATRRRDEWLGQLEQEANRFAGDPYGWRLLADARCQSEQFAACEAAAERALAISPDDGRAALRKAEAQIALADDLPADQRDARFEAARALIAKALAADPDDPLALLAYYRSFRAEGRAAPDDAFAGLRTAVLLVPQQSGPRLTYAAELIARGRHGEARAILRPLAFAPHDSSASARARGMLDSIESEADEASAPTAE